MKVVFLYKNGKKVNDITKVKVPIAIQKEILNSLTGKEHENDKKVS